MDYKKLINDMQEEPNGYYVVIGYFGLLSYKVNEVYFTEDYRMEYGRKLTTLAMLLCSWYETRVLFKTEDPELKRTFCDLNQHVFKLETEEQVMRITDLILQCITDKNAEISFLYENKKRNEKFVFNIPSDCYVSFHGLSEESLEYVRRQANKQGLNLYLDED